MASTVGSTAVDTTISGQQKPTLRSRFQDFATFLFNPDEGTVLGRTARSWGEIGLFYLVFYACLAGFFAAMMAVFYQTLDWNIPRLRGTDSLLRQNPGLGMRPIPDVATTLIRFNKARPATFAKYVDHIQGFLNYYENELQQAETGTLIDCTSIQDMRRPEEWDKACRFDIKELGDDCVKQQAFGFEDGQPCILLKMNRVYDWIPEAYSNDSLPAEIRDTWAEYHVTVRCDGENPADKDNIGPLLYFPSNGFHFKYFPYRNQQGYRSPLVFVRLNEPKSGVLIMITCKIYARNIAHNFNEKAGMIHFEVMVD